MKRILLLVGALFLLISCTSELDQMINGSRSDKARQATVFQASVEGCSMPETKVYADENLKVLWNADDRISIFNKTTFNYQFAFTGDDGDTAGSFEEIPTSDFITGTDIDNIYAVYPYDRKNKLNNSCVLTVTLPSEQAYKESSFGIGANTMVAASSGNFLAFKNVGGYLNLRLYGDDVSVSRITIKGNNGEKIAGKASIEMPLGGVPTVTMDNSATDEISVVCNPAVKIGADANSYTDFWFVIPPVYFSLGFTIMVTDDKGGVFEKVTSKGIMVSRNKLEWMAALKVVPNYDNVIVQFEDANFKAYCVENFDRDGDGEISMAEANAVTEINVNTEIVASLKGIEYFKNLQFLTCRLNWRSAGTDANGKRHYYNANNEEIFSLLTSLDLSHNTALATLVCDSNQLTSLDVSNNTALTDLVCSYNQLTSLDVSHNTALTSMDCNSNQLTSLDVSHCAALKYLYCDSNQLTSLDVSYNTELTDLVCSYNQLTSLDVSHNTALTSLSCGSNQLTGLDVSHNTELRGLSCYSNQLTSLDVSHNTKLTSLSCYSNQLTSLDVSNNTALRSLFCDSNQLTSLDVSYNTALTTLSCDSNQLTSLDVSNNTMLTRLHCMDNQLTSLDVSHNTALTDLWCGRNQLTVLDVSYNTGLTRLYCESMNSLTDIWFLVGQTIERMRYDEGVATIHYRGEGNFGTVAEAVDLGLPSGVLWASMNIGANSPEDYGDYYGWGEVEPNSHYSWNYYKFGSESNFSKYNSQDGLTQLELEDDAAHVNWKGDWRMPTHDEEVELTEYCSIEYTTMNGVSGAKFTGPNGNSIFLPLGGIIDGTDYNCVDDAAVRKGEGGWYWSSTLNGVGSAYACGLCFWPSLLLNVSDHERCDGHMIRPVKSGSNEGRVSITLPPDDEIWYESYSGNVIPLAEDSPLLVSNTYSNGKGIYKFSTALTDIGGMFDYSDQCGTTKENEDFKSLILPKNITQVGQFGISHLSYATKLVLPYNLSSMKSDCLCRFGEKTPETSNIYFIGETAPSFVSTSIWNMHDLVSGGDKIDNFYYPENNSSYNSLLEITIQGTATHNWIPAKYSITFAN